MKRKDFRSEPVRTMVVMGESNAYGMCASDPTCEWVQVVASLIRKHQDGWLRVLNNAIPANVISPRAPAYSARIIRRAKSGGRAYTMSPSAIERFEADMIAHAPDLAVYAYGLNDSRCGHPAPSFLQDYDTIVRRTRDSLPDALIVLVGPYWNLQYDTDLWDRPSDGNDFGVPGDEIVLAYNTGIAELAERYGALFVDVYSPMAGAPWLLHQDACHFHDLGQELIGMTVAAAIAANCSFLSAKSIRADRDGGFAIPNTGGTNAMPEAVDTWRYVGADQLG